MHTYFKVPVIVDACLKSLGLQMHTYFKVLGIVDYLFGGKENISVDEKICSSAFGQTRQVPRVLTLVTNFTEVCAVINSAMIWIVIFS